LFGDPRSRGLGIALAASFLLHIVLFAAFGRFHIQPVDRTFFAPLHMVDLVERRPGPAPKPGPKAGPETPAEKPKAQPETRKPVPTVQTKTAPAAKPKALPPPSVARAPTTVPLPSPEAPPEESSEERVAERIARIREKMGTAPAPARQEDQGAPRGVRDAIESIRKRVGAEGGGRAVEGGAVGIRAGGSNVLQEVRLRAYYNQLWDHVTSHWTLPPSLKGKDFSVIVSVVLDRQGTILKSWVEEASGSDAFDQSALRALQRAQPLPPIPDAVPDATLEVGFRFHPD
jgi:TonB family protein